MAREDFYRDIRLAVSFMAPRVSADSPFIDASYIEKMLRGADLWLTRKAVEAFRPEDYPDLHKSVRDELQKAVSDFTLVAQKVPANSPATLEQRDAALRPFKYIVQTVQSLVREDWLRASSELLTEAERWSKEENWPTKRFSKDVTEDFIGQYKQDRLVFAAEGAQLVFVPVGRYAPGTEGMFDLAVLPAYDSVMVVRRDKRWFIHSLSGDAKQLDWSKKSFVETSLQLARLQ